MKIRSSLSIIMIILLPVFCKAQNLNDKILMTVGENKIQPGEFIRMYKKSMEPDNTLDIDGYLQDYIVYKIKVAEAIQEGYDTTRAFRNELNGYRNQLAHNYLTDTQTKESLVQKAYQRSLTEINAWHILVALAPEAATEDTLKAWQKACDIRERIITGESFEEVARGTSDDQSVKVNGGNLGYFTVFQMIMPFEDADLTRRGIDAKIYTLKSSGEEKLLASAYKKYSRKPDRDSRLIEKFNRNNDTLLVIKEGTWHKGDNPEIDNVQWITGSQSFLMDGYPSIILIKDVSEPVPLAFEEVRGEMMSGYQEYLEREWQRQLKEKYSVTIDNMVLEEVKKKLSHE